jgi:ankyrin repeat protein
MLWSYRSRSSTFGSTAPLGRQLASWGSILFPALLVGCAGSEAVGDLIDAAADGDMAKVQELLRSGVDINGHARDDWTALTIAAREGHLGIVRLLLKNGADVNEREGGGHTALFWAEKRGHTDVSALLKAAGAGPSQ